MRTSAPCASMAMAVALFLTSLAGQVRAAECKAPSNDRAPVLSSPTEMVVIGSGRLQFYSAPNEACRISGIFLVPRDQVIAYAKTDDGWTSVIYMRSNGSEVDGWIRSQRLEMTGTVGPSQ